MIAGLLGWLGGWLARAELVELREQLDKARAALETANIMINGLDEQLSKQARGHMKAVSALATAPEQALKAELEFALDAKRRAEVERDRAVAEREVAEKARAEDGVWGAPVVEERTEGGWRRRALLAEATLRKLNARVEHGHDCDRLAAQLVNQEAGTDARSR